MNLKVFYYILNVMSILLPIPKKSITNILLNSKTPIYLPKLNNYIDIKGNNIIYTGTKYYKYITDNYSINIYTSHLWDKETKLFTTLFNSIIHYPLKNFKYVEYVYLTPIIPINNTYKYNKIPDLRDIYIIKYNLLKCYGIRYIFEEDFKIYKLCDTFINIENNFISDLKLNFNI